MFYLTPYILYLFQHSSDYIDILFPIKKDNLYIYIYLDKCSKIVSNLKNKHFCTRTFFIALMSKILDDPINISHHIL